MSALQWEPVAVNERSIRVVDRDRFVADDNGVPFMILRSFGLWYLYHNGRWVGRGTKTEMLARAEELRS